ncbi:MAG: 16S rRNA (uracil(1498)-N(3))-methyltransferase [Endomicrobium sp.]|jgi:16S rRNA (uracil1498-N3)-methyltransferase|nr:16S rRNA (uracil(1498)-N(3))-methyltransferase [Endomicrobium sp.]
MSHFYVNPKDITKRNFTINNNQSYHYIFNVRRFKVGKEIMIFNGIGNSYKAKITNINKNIISGEILSSSYLMSNFSIKLYVSIPKNKRFEWLVEKCAEIGISEIIPIRTKRSTKNDLSKNKFERYKKISIAASSQCLRNDIMKITETINFEVACKKAANEEYCVNVLPWEKEDTNILNRTIFKSIYSKVNIFIGPEGGFENKEIEFAKSLGITTVTLGKNILRTETAAIAASVLILSLKMY